MKRRNWIILILILVVIGAGGYYFLTNRASNGQAAQRAQFAGTGADAAQLVQIQPAAAIVDEVQAAGAIDLSSEQIVALGVDGTVTNIAVKVGDVITAGQTLLTLDTTELERALRRAEIAVQTQVNSQKQLTKAASTDDIAAAEADLAAAEAELADVQAGPTAQELAAARSSVSSAWAEYNELLAGPSEAEQTQLIADLKRKEVALAEAQRAYDKVAWQNEVGMTTQAADLQQATIDYEEAKAAYEESSAPATTSDVQSALSAAQDAQQALDDLLAQPTKADLASAESTVASAKSALADLQTGADDLEVQESKLSLESALVDLEEAYANLDQAAVKAPITGAVLAVDAEVGQQVSRGAVVVTLADITQLELTIDVADVDINQVRVGQAATVEIDAFPGKSYAGAVASIAPASNSESGVVNYPVTIHLTDDDLSGVRPGMKAVATLENTASNASAESWLVPSSALQTAGDGTTVTVLRGDAATTVDVAPGSVQGEWTIVEAPGLQAGDQVTASLTSSVGEDNIFAPNGPRGPDGGGPPGSD